MQKPQFLEPNAHRNWRDEKSFREGARKMIEGGIVAFSELGPWDATGAARDLYEGVIDGCDWPKNAWLAIGENFPQTAKTNLRGISLQEA